MFFIVLFRFETVFLRSPGWPAPLATLEVWDGRPKSHPTPLALPGWGVIQHPAPGTEKPEPRCGLQRKRRGLQAGLGDRMDSSPRLLVS